MAEWLGNGLQNHVQQFDSAWHLITTISGCSETGTPADLWDNEKSMLGKNKVLALRYGNARLDEDILPDDSCGKF